MKLKRLSSNKWQLLEPWSYSNLTIPEGFITDGASVPRLFWWIASPSGDLFEASVVHDYMYSNSINSKRDADKMFKIVANYYGANKLRIFLAYNMVKIFGKGNY